MDRRRTCKRMASYCNQKLLDSTHTESNYIDMPPRKPETINTIRNRTEKTCSSCGVCKSLCEFGKDKGMLDGRYSHCKLCSITRSHEDYKKRKDKIQKYSTAYRKTERGKMARKKESETQKKKINYKANYTVTNAVRDENIKKKNILLCMGNHLFYKQLKSIALLFTK